MSRETDVVTLSGAEYDALIDELQEVKRSLDSWVGMYKTAQRRADDAEKALAAARAERDAFLLSLTAAEERAETAFERAAQVADENEPPDCGCSFPCDCYSWYGIARRIAAAIRKLKEGK